MTSAFETKESFIEFLKKSKRGDFIELLTGADFEFDVNTDVWNDRPLLFWTLAYNNEEGIDYLLSIPSIDVNKHIDDTCLHIAVENCSLSVVEKLLDLGADIHAIGSMNNGKPIHYSVYSKIDPLPKLKLLLDRGADINSLELFNNTPLHLAIIKNKEACAELLKRGADRFIKNSDDRSCVELAEIYKINLEK